MSRLWFTSGRWRAACLVGLTSVAVCGCGGSSANPSTPTPTTAPGPTAPAGPAKRRFVAQADHVCTAADKLLAAQQAKVNTAATAEQATSSVANRAAVASAMHAETSLARLELSRLRALSPPAGDRVAVGKYLAAVASQTQLVDQFADAVKTDDVAAETTLSTRLTSGETAVDNLAKAYGFKVCGSTTSSSS